MTLRITLYWEHRVMPPITPHYHLLYTYFYTIYQSDFQGEPKFPYDPSLPFSPPISLHKFRGGRRGVLVAPYTYDPLHTAPSLPVLIPE